MPIASILRKTVLTTICAVPGFFSYAFAQNSLGPPRIVTWNCSGCHGVDGISQLSYIPRLAGQQETYLRKRLAAFQRTEKPPTDELLHRLVALRSPRSAADSQGAVHMVGVAHAATEEDLTAAAAWYATQKLAAEVPHPDQSGGIGADLFAKGLAQSQIPACQTCHGARGQGSEKAPRLQGQNKAYILNRLESFKAAAPAPGAVMSVIAKKLDAEQAKAIADYLNTN